MKLLKIENKKCFFSVDGTEFSSIVDISKEDIYKILDEIYKNDDVKIDECTDSTEIENDVEKLMYLNIYNQIHGFIQNKTNLVNEINNELKSVKEKYDIE